MKQEEQPITELDKHLSKLYMALPYTKVLSYDDCLVYIKVPIGKNTEMRKEIEDKIKELELPLMVEPRSINSIFQDTICVQAKK
jgi:hypothetical protein